MFRSTVATGAKFCCAILIQDIACTDNGEKELTQQVYPRTLLKEREMNFVD